MHKKYLAQKKINANAALNQWTPGNSLPWQGVEEEREEEEEEQRNGIQNCMVCSRWFDGGLKLQYHYDEVHSVKEPSLVTTLAFRCNWCKTFFARKESLKAHVCPAKAKEKPRIATPKGGWLPVRHGPDLPSPED